MFGQQDGKRRLINILNHFSAICSKCGIDFELIELCVKLDAKDIFNNSVIMRIPAFLIFYIYLLLDANKVIFIFLILVHSLGSII